MKKKIGYGILGLGVLGLYWLYKEIRWRRFNDNTLQIETLAGLDLKKITLVWQNYYENNDYCVFKDGQQIREFELPHGWTIRYNDSCSGTTNSNIDRGDSRKDADYKLTVFKKLDTLFCDYKINGRQCAVFPLKTIEYVQH
jgi:hypothetical protein